MAYAIGLDWRLDRERRAHFSQVMIATAPQTFCSTLPPLRCLSARRSRATRVAEILPLQRHPLRLLISPTPQQVFRLFLFPLHLLGPRDDVGRFAVDEDSGSFCSSRRSTSNSSSSGIRSKVPPSCCLSSSPALTCTHRVWSAVSDSLMRWTVSTCAGHGEDATMISYRPMMWFGFACCMTASYSSSWR